MSKKYQDLLIIIISIFTILVLLLIPKHNDAKIINNEAKIYNNLNKIADSISAGYRLISDTKLSNNIINLVYKNNISNEYVTYFIDGENGDILSYKSIIKPKFIADFNNVEERLLKEKYPEFIINGIYKDDTIRNVEVKSNEIIIHYSNVLTEPKYNEPLYLIINNNEVSKYLNYDFSLDEEYKNESAYDIDPNKKYIAFSFDDGPSKTNTKDIVDYLTKNKMHATFFEVGYLMNSNPDIVKYVIDNNMEVGSHTYSHKNLKRIKMDKVKEEIEKTDSIYYDITGEKLTLLRPPYGSVNEKIKESFDYSYIIWSVDTLDWRYKDSEYIYDYVINNVNDGDIVLMHDIHETTKQAVEKILPELYVRGYRVVTVSELAAIKNTDLVGHEIYRSIK